ncbi:MAG: hypothetical protein V7641_203 [Blastocatellia bacterium]
MSESNVREEWSNCIGNQPVLPLHLLRPTGTFNNRFSERCGFDASGEAKRFAV